MNPVQSKEITGNEFNNDFSEVLSTSGGLIEIALAPIGGSKFNRAIYFEKVTPLILEDLFAMKSNISFLADCEPGQIDVPIGRETFRQSKNDWVSKKSIVSFDIDLKDIEPGYSSLPVERRRALVISTAAAIIEKAKEHKVPIWIINSSGNGIHLHFKFARPFKVGDTKEYRRSYSTWMDLLQMTLGASIVFDRACANPARIMRLPGSTNWKDREHPIKTEVLFHNPDATADRFLTQMEIVAPKQFKSRKFSLEAILKHFGYQKMNTFTKKGDQIVCSSPFSSDSSPSFYFHPEKQIYYDFSNGEGGSTFQLIRKLAGLDDGADSALTLKVIQKIAGDQGASASRFLVRSDGVFFSKSIDEDSESLWICSPLEIKSATRDHRSESWGRILLFTDQDNIVKMWSMPMEMLAGDGLELRRELLKRGLRVSSRHQARTLLLEYIQTAEVNSRVRCVEQIGWNGPWFILPYAVYGGKDCQNEVALQKDGEFACFQRRGTLEEWKRLVASPCRGNTRLVFALAAAFTPPLLKLVGEESGGIHFVGSSSIGKTLALRIAGSVWGGGGVSGYLRKWRSTVNGLESLAADRNDCLLTLDEISEISAKDAAFATYMLANGSGKKRMGRHGEAKEALEWRTLFLSSGEIGLSNLLTESGEKHRAGQFVRLVEIEADAGKGLGIFDTIGDACSPAILADTLRRSCDKFYGTAIDEFLKQLVCLPYEDIESFRKQALPQIANLSLTSQIGRVAKRFALIATGGILASRMNILPLKETEIITAIKICFNHWASQHSNHPDFESEKILSMIRRYLQLNGCAFFPEWDGKTDVHTDKKCCGYRLLTEDGNYSWLVLNEVMRQEICEEFDFRKVVRVLKNRGVLVCKNGQSSIPLRLPNFGLVRVYQLSPEVLMAHDAHYDNTDV